MRNHIAPFLAIGATVALASSCDALGGSKGEATAKADATTAAPSSAAAPGNTATTPAATSMAATKSSAPQGYSLDGIKTIPDNCSSAGVIVTSAPKSVGSSYTWPFTRYAAYANRQFKYGSAEAGGVVFEQYEDDKTGGFTLVAKCGDGATCNQFAAMYKAIVRSSNPQPFCGPTTAKGTKQTANVVPSDGAWTPKTTIDKCTRIGACMIATDRATPGDPALECQKAPAKFKLECAARESCAEVLACASK